MEGSQFSGSLLLDFLPWQEGGLGLIIWPCSAAPPNLRKVHSIVAGPTNALELNFILRLLPLWVLASLSTKPEYFYLLPACGYIQDSVFNTLSGTLTCHQQEDWQGTWSTVSLETAVQVPFMPKALHRCHPSMSFEHLPSALWGMRSAPGRRKDLLGSFSHSDFTFDPPSTHSNFPLGKLLFIPQNLYPALLFGKALLAPY